MEFDQLQALVTLAQTRNFSRAAHQLFRTQPAVSLQIKALEEELEVSLVERLPRDVRLTDAGALLVERARTILRERTQAREDIANLQGLGSGTLRIACSENISRYYLAPVIARFLKEYPAIEIIIQNMASPAAEKSCVEGLADFAFTLLPTEHCELQAHVVLEYRDVGVCALSHPLAKRKRISLIDLADVRLLLLNPATKSHQLLARDFVQAGIAPKAALELGSADSQKEFARIGLGVGIIPGYTLTQGSRSLHSFQIAGLSKRQIAICTRPSSSSKLLKKFLEFNH